MRTNADQDRSLFHSPATKSGRLTGTRLWERQPEQEPALPGPRGPGLSRPVLPWLPFLHTPVPEHLHAAAASRVMWRSPVVLQQKAFRINRRRVLEDSAKQSLNPNLKILSTLFGFVNI